MKHKPEMIIRYAEDRLQAQKRRKKSRLWDALISSFLAVLACSLLITAIKDEKIATLSFLKGFSFAVLSLPFISIMMSAVLFAIFDTKSMGNDVHELLIQLWKEKTTRAEPSGGEERR